MASIFEETTEVSQTHFFFFTSCTPLLMPASGADRKKAKNAPPSPGGGGAADVVSLVADGKHDGAACSEGAPGNHPIPGGDYLEGSERNAAGGPKAPAGQDGKNKDDPRLDEDLPVEWPLPGSRLDTAVSLANGCTEDSSGLPAIILDRKVESGQGPPALKALVGRSELVQLQATGEDEKLAGVVVGDVVLVRKRVVQDDVGTKTSWVLLQRISTSHMLENFPEDELPLLKAKIVRSEGKGEVVATVAFLDSLVRVIPEGDREPAKEENEGEALGYGDQLPEALSVGKLFWFTPVLSPQGELQPVRSTHVQFPEHDPEWDGDLGVSAMDLAPDFHFFGRKALGLLSRHMDLVCDPTVSRSLSGLPLGGGRAFFEALTGGKKGGFTWGEMVTALAYQAVMGEGVDDDAESVAESPKNPGKANDDRDNDEKLGVEQGQLKTQKHFRQLDAKMNGYRRQVIFFFLFFI